MYQLSMGGLAADDKPQCSFWIEPNMATMLIIRKDACRDVVHLAGMLPWALVSVCARTVRSGEPKRHLESPGGLLLLLRLFLLTNVVEVY